MRRRTRLTALSVSVCTAMCLVGCFDMPLPVADSVEKWDAIGVDESLVGDWEYEGDITSFEMHEDGFLIMWEVGSDEEAEFAIRTFEQDGMNFVLVVQYAAAVSGFEDEEIEWARLGLVWQYVIDDNEMVWRWLKFEVLEAAIGSGEVSGSLDEDENEDEFGLTSLDDPTIAWLVQAFSDEDNIEFELGPIEKLNDNADE